MMNFRKWSVLTAAGLIFALGRVLMAAEAGPAPSAQPEGGRVFELRTYITHPGRLTALHKRFQEHTLRLFKKHGIEVVAFWTPTEGEEAKNTLIYVVAFPSKEARDKAWKAFSDDPEWKEAYAASHRDGPIVDKVESKLMRAVDYSPMK